MRSDMELLAMSAQIVADLGEAGDESEEAMQAAFTPEELHQLGVLLAEEINSPNTVQGRKEIVRVLEVINKPTE